MSLDYFNINIPSSFTHSGSLPETNNLTTEEITFTNDLDNTTIKIPSGSLYNKITSEIPNEHNFRGSNNINNVKYTFAKGTTLKTYNDGTYVYTTPDGFEYKMAEPISSNKDTIGNINVNLKYGDVIIYQSSEEKSTIDKIMTARNEKIIDVAASEILSNSVMQEITRTFNKSVIYFLNTLLKDILVSVIIYIIIINITKWGIIPADILYPIDIGKYPYVYNNIGLNNDLSSFEPKDDGLYCRRMINTNNISIDQKIINDPKIKNALEYINPDILNVNEENVYITSKWLQSSCSTTSNRSDAFSVFRYWVLYLTFHQILYHNVILNKFHSIITGLSVISEYFTSESKYSNNTLLLFKKIAFATIIFSVIMILQPTNLILQKLFDYKITPTLITSPQDAFIYALFDILAICLFIFVSSFFLLFIGGLIVHLFFLIRIGLESNSVECTILSFITIASVFNGIFKLITYLIDRTYIGGGLSSFQNLFTGMFDLSNIISTISSFFGIFIPFILSFNNSFSVSFKLIWSAFIGIRNNSDMLYRLANSVILLILCFLVFNIYKIIGKVEGLISIGVIIVFSMITFFRGS
jgi:hypothetical protein